MTNNIEVVPGQSVILKKNHISLALISRTIFFALSAMFIMGILFLSGHDNPVEGYTKWWMLQAALANLLSFYFLKSLLKKEGLTYRTFIFANLKSSKNTLLSALLFLIVGFIFGYIGTVGGSLLIFGGAPPETMFQGLPLWAAITSLVMFPLSVALTELPTYLGYAFTRLESKLRNKWAGIFIVSFWLAFQHTVLPLVFEWDFFLWRFISFLPLAIVLGYIYSRTRRLLPLMIAHFVMDLQMAVLIFIGSL